MKIEKSYFEVMGLCCSSEVPLIERVLKQLNGVQDISVVVPTRTVIVVHDVLNISSAEIGNKKISKKMIQLITTV